jgi:hypothetical protein
MAISKKTTAQDPQPQHLPQHPEASSLKQDPAENLPEVLPLPGPVAISDMFAEDAGAGLESFGSKDLQIPFIMIAQANSPQVNPSDGKYVVGCQVGDFFNSVTGQLYKGKTGFKFVPCGYSMMAVEWRPNRGGLVAQHAMGSDIYKNSKFTPDGKRVVGDGSGNFLAETAYHFGLVVEDDGAAYAAIISMVSSQLKASRKWNTVVDSRMMKRSDGSLFKAPMFSATYHFTSVPQENAKGKWMGFSISNLGNIEDTALYLRARDMHKMIAEGKIKASAPVEDADGEKKDDIPF